MPKLELDHVRELQDAFHEWIRFPMFCNYCGETEPEDGFYPLSVSLELSSYMCNKCEREMRERYAKG